MVLNDERNDQLPGVLTFVKKKKDLTGDLWNCSGELQLWFVFNGFFIVIPFVVAWH